MDRFILAAILVAMAPEAQVRGATGVVQTVDGRAIAFGSEQKNWTIPLELITKLEVIQGRKGHVLAGILIGAGVGFIAGMIAIEGGSSSSCSGSGNSYDDICRATVAGATVLGGGLGAGIGALIKGDRWVPVPLATLTPQGGFARGLGPLSRASLSPGQP